MKTADEVKPNNAPSYCALYPGLAEICVQHGYALAIHGSMARDFDLIAVPWAESPSTPEAVIDAITSRYAIHYIKSDTNPKEMRHGRIAHTLCVMGDWQLDLSFTPLKGEIMSDEATRDMFAAAALTGLLSKLPVIDQDGELGVQVEDKVGYNKDVCNSAFEFADTMMEARKIHPEDVEPRPEALPAARPPAIIDRPWKQRFS